MNHYLRFVLAIAVAIAAGQSTAQCPLQFTDLTDYSSEPSENPPTHAFTFRAEGPVGSRVGFDLIPRTTGNAAFRSVSCPTPNSCTMIVMCVHGDWDLRAYAQCSASSGSSATLPIEAPDAGPEIEIAGITDVGGGRYRIDAMRTLQVGQPLSAPTYEVHKRLAPDIYAPPTWTWDPVVHAAPGDKVGAVISVCNDQAHRTMTAYAIIPEVSTVEVAVLDGDGQKAVPGNAVEKPLKVKFTASSPSFNLQSLTAIFEVIAAPANAAGHGVGANDTAVALTYSVPVAADGTASAVFVAGSLPGSYVVRVKSPMSATGAEAKFTTTAVNAASVALLNDTTDLAELADTYIASGTEPTLFFAMALDAAGEKIGPIKCNWSTSAKGNPSTRGAGSLNPAAGAAAVTFQPTKVGKLNLTATSATAIKGVSSATTELFLTSLYVSVQNDFVLDNPVDDSARFVPGMYLDGTNVALDVMESTGQFISLHVPTGGAKGKATFRVDSTNYPGLAMNYPLNGDTTEDMMFTNGQQSITVDFDSKTGDTWTTLLVRDFGASGTIQVSIETGKKSYSLKALKLPVDADGNGLPDAGWKVGTTLTPINANILTRDEDFDIDPSASGAPPGGILGDGLAAFEEYRGFVVIGDHERLDPSKKDLFFVADAEMLILPVNSLAILTKLPHSLHFLDMDEARMSQSSDPAEDNVRPVINPNRGNIVGAFEQRAIRLRSRMDAPLFHEDKTGQDYPGHFVALGYTWREGEDLATIHELSSIGVSSPNGTIAVELYPRGFNNFAIHYGANDVPESMVDPYGQPVVPCTNELTDVHCVVFDSTRRIVRRPFQEPQLYATADGDDYYTKVGWGDCPLFLNPIVMTPQRFQQTHTTVAGHEVGHALRLSHQNSICSDIMFTLVIPPNPNTNQGPIRHPISDVLPLPSGYGLNSIQGMRLHENP